MHMAIDFRGGGGGMPHPNPKRETWSFSEYLAYAQFHDVLADFFRAGVGGTFTGEWVLVSCIGLSCL